VAAWLEKVSDFARDAVAPNDLGVAPLSLLLDGIDRANAAHARVSGRPPPSPSLGPNTARPVFLGGALPGSAFAADPKELPGSKQQARAAEVERQRRRKEASVSSLESGHVPRYMHLGGGSGGSTAAWQPRATGDMSATFSERARARAGARPSSASGRRSHWAGQPASAPSTAQSTPRESWGLRSAPPKGLGTRTFGAGGGLFDRPADPGRLTGTDRAFVATLLSPH